mgnify:CR=1 FL=1
MSALGIAGTVVFLLFGMGGLIFWFLARANSDFDSLLPWAIMFILTAITIGIVDSKLSKKSNKN